METIDVTTESTEGALVAERVTPTITAPIVLTDEIRDAIREVVREELRAVNTASFRTIPGTVVMGAIIKTTPQT